MIIIYITNLNLYNNDIHLYLWLTIYNNPKMNIQVALASLYPETPSLAFRGVDKKKRGWYGPTLRLPTKSSTYVSGWTLALVPVVMLALLLVSDASGASPPLEQVVVTGTRTEKFQENAPVSVDVISSRELEMVATTTVAEALNYMHGIVVKPNVKDGTNVFMQGFDGNRVLVLVDGLPVISPTGSAADLNQISAYDIERIEVIRGAASVLYGSSAMGGVINIITKKRRGQSARAALLVGHYEVDNTDGDALRRQLNLGASVRKNNLSSQISIQDLYDPGFAYQEHARSQDAGSVDKQFGNIRLAGEFAPFTVDYRGQFLQEEKYRKLSALPGGFDNYYQSKVEQNEHSLAFTGSDHWQVQGRYNTHSEASGQRSSPRKTEITNITLDSQTVFDWLNAEWVSGIRIYQERLNQINLITGLAEVDDKSRSATEAFTQTDWTWEQFELVGGIRIQNDESFGTHHALRFNSMWKSSNSGGAVFTWRGSIGDSYRVPNIKERFFKFDHSNLGYKVLGNQNLSPETARSFTARFDWKQPLNSFEYVSANINFHYSQAKNFITTQFDYLDENNVAISTYKNVDEAVLQGVDIGFGFQQAQQRFKLGYSYLDAREPESNRRLEERPYHQIKANYWVDLPIIKSNLLLYAIYESGEAFDEEELTEGAIVNSYTTLNVTFNVNINDNFHWKLGVEDITDEHRDENLRPTQFDPRPVSSRFLFTGIQYNF